MAGTDRDTIISQYRNDRDPEFNEGLDA